MMKRAMIKRAVKDTLAKNTLKTLPFWPRPCAASINQTPKQCTLVSISPVVPDKKSWAWLWCPACGACWSASSKAPVIDV